ncbi:unnamed protein product [Brassica rapa subsp. trilocularis]
MNRRENKNEAEAAVGDNIGKVFPKFYLMATHLRPEICSGYHLSKSSLRFFELLIG